MNKIIDASFYQILPWLIGVVACFAAVYFTTTAVRWLRRHWHTLFEKETSKSLIYSDDLTSSLNLLRALWKAKGGIPPDFIWDAVLTRSYWKNQDENILLLLSMLEDAEERVRAYFKVKAMNAFYIAKIAGINIEIEDLETTAWCLLSEYATEGKSWKAFDAIKLLEATGKKYPSGCFYLDLMSSDDRCNSLLDRVRQIVEAPIGTNWQTIIKEALTEAVSNLHDGDTEKLIWCYRMLEDTDSLIRLAERLRAEKRCSDAYEAYAFAAELLWDKLPTKRQLDKLILLMNAADAIGNANPICYCVGTNVYIMCIKEMQEPRSRKLLEKHYRKL